MTRRFPELSSKRLTSSPITIANSSDNLPLWSSRPPVPRGSIRRRGAIPLDLSGYGMRRRCSFPIVAAITVSIRCAISSAIRAPRRNASSPPLGYLGGGYFARHLHLMPQFGGPVMSAGRGTALRPGRASALPHSTGCTVAVISREGRTGLTRSHLKRVARAGRPSYYTPIRRAMAEFNIPHFSSKRKCCDRTGPDT